MYLSSWDGLAKGSTLKLAGEKCTLCPNANFPVVPGTGPDKANLVVVGEAPGRTEVTVGSPFVGRAGKLLDQLFADAKLDRTTAYITNSVLCFPNGPPAQQAIAACNERLLAEISARQPSVVLLLGGVALQAVLGKRKITRERGRVYVRNGWTVVPTLHPAAVLRQPRLYRDALHDFELAREFLQGVVKGRPQLLRTICSTKEDVDQMVDDLKDEPVLTIDFEVSSTQEIICLGVGILSGTTVRVWTVPGGLLVNHEGMKRLFNGRGICAVDARYELKVCWNLGWNPHVVGDPMLIHYTLDERTGTHSLEDMVTQEYSSEPEIEWWAAFKPKRSALEKLDRDAVYWYNAMDVYYTVRLMRDLASRMDKDGLFVYTDRLVPAELALARMEYRGVAIDTEWLSVLEVDISKRVKKQAELLVRLAGREFNPNSPRQVSELLYAENNVPESKFGRTTEASYLASIQNFNEFTRNFVPEFREYRRLKKLYGTYILGIKNKLDVYGRIHGRFNICGTSTGRLSSSNPNLQNIPARSGSDAQAIRNLFIPTPGYTWVKADYSQAEIRILAYYSRDEKLINIIHSGQDLHESTARLIFNLNPTDDVPKQLRHVAKTLNFAVIYGAGPETIREHVRTGLGIDLPLDKAALLVEMWFGTFQKATEWIEAIKREVARTKMLKTPLGRVRRWPIIDTKTLREAVNFPIQSLASDITLKALIRLDHTLPPTDKLLLTVHDELDFETCRNPIDCAMDVKRVMLEVADSVLQGVVPFDVDVSVGDRWGNLEPLEIDSTH